MGIENEMFFRLLTRDPRTVIASSDIGINRPSVHGSEYDRLRKPQIIPRNLWDTKCTHSFRIDPCFAWFVLFRVFRVNRGSTFRLLKNDPRITRNTRNNTKSISGSLLYFL